MHVVCLSFHKKIAFTGNIMDITVCVPDNDWWRSKDLKSAGGHADVNEEVFRLSWPQVTKLNQRS